MSKSKRDGREDRGDTWGRESCQGKPPAVAHTGPEGKSGQIWYLVESQRGGVTMEVLSTDWLLSAET